ncbi:MAG TPA: tetratricopeptide repeat protein [Gemmatimonadaceae bacterium]|nr:tetratricopeptide repeat protein [Gemmatimonadaceae bacterium]
MGSEGMLRHLAFFEELSGMDESDTSWRAVSAGLVVMRLVDRWIEDASVSAPIDAWAMSAVREAIAQVSETTPIRRILTSVVDVMVASTPADLHALVPRLMAYGQALEYEAKWALAGDVYGTITAHVHPVEDADLATGAHLQLGFCLRTLGEFEGAITTYERASAIALQANDLIGVLRGRLGVARVVSLRGNIPAAESILADAIETAREHGLDQVRSAALIDRAYIAGVCDQHDRAIRYSYEALELSTSQRTRDRILNNIATAFRFLGLRGPARDAYLVLATTADEQYIRWMAELNLMELAALDGVELQFDKFRRDLESADLSPQLRVTYLLHVGRGYHALGRAESAIPYLERAIEVAAQYQFNQMVFEAEAALAAARRGSRADVASASTVPESLQDVVDAVHEMRETAGVG